MSLEAMYPSMFTAGHAETSAPGIVDATTKAPMYPNSPELVDRVPVAEQAAAPNTPVKESPETVTSSESSAPPTPVALTPETLAAAIPAEVAAQRLAEKSIRHYATAHLEVLGKAEPNTEAALVNQEIVAMAFDHGLSREDLRTVVHADRKFGSTPPTPEILAQWAALVTDQNLADAQRAVDRDPRVGAMLVKRNIAMHPSIIKMLAKSAQQRSTTRK